MTTNRVARSRTRRLVARGATLLLVLVLHLGLIVALLRVSPVGRTVIAHAPPVELLVLPPVTVPRIRSDDWRPSHLRGDAALSIVAPSLDVGSQTPAPAGSDGHGSGVDWSAERRRALQAFEIRNYKPAGSDANAAVAANNDWWPLAQHHAGEQYKTPGGDWIVWIDANCYRVASAAATPYAPTVNYAPTVCLKQTP